jgi:hypothetical protein
MQLPGGWVTICFREPASFVIFGAYGKIQKGLLFELELII